MNMLYGLLLVTRPWLDMITVFCLYHTRSNGDVRINWIHVTTKGTTLKSGDIVSVSGKGRLKVTCQNLN